MIRRIIPLSMLLLTVQVWAAEFEIFKSPSCGCCQAWTEALESAGHTVVIHHTEALHQIKLDAGLPAELGACHTAFVDGYVVEGHVPLQAIDELLAEKPDIKGLAVPGMPAESLGMEYGREPQRYKVYGFDDQRRITPKGEYSGTTRLPDSN